MAIWDGYLMFVKIGRFQTGSRVVVRMMQPS